MTDHFLDQRLVRAVLGGDLTAFGSLVDRHHARCSRIAARIIGNREDAEEAVQDAFLRSFRALAEYEDRERFSAWLTRILVNQCRTVLARARKRDARYLHVEPHVLELLFPVEHSGAAEGAWPELEHALAQLPLAQREAIVLRYGDDLSYEEMARITGAGESALKMRVQRAFAQLRHLLAEVACA